MYIHKNRGEKSQHNRCSLKKGENPLEKEMATHSSILTQEIPWTVEPGGLQSMGSQRVRHHSSREKSPWLWHGQGRNSWRDFWRAVLRCLWWGVPCESPCTTPTQPALLPDGSEVSGAIEWGTLVGLAWTQMTHVDHRTVRKGDSESSGHPKMDPTVSILRTLQSTEGVRHRNRALLWAMCGWTQKTPGESGKPLWRRWPLSRKGEWKGLSWQRKEKGAWQNEACS